MGICYYSSNTINTSRAQLLQMNVPYQFYNYLQKLISCTCNLQLAFTYTSIWQSTDLAANCCCRWHGNMNQDTLSQQFYWRSHVSYSRYRRLSLSGILHFKKCLESNQTSDLQILATRNNEVQVTSRTSNSRHLMELPVDATSECSFRQNQW